MKIPATALQPGLKFFVKQPVVVKAKAILATLSYFAGPGISLTKVDTYFVWVHIGGNKLESLSG